MGASRCTSTVSQLSNKANWSGRPQHIARSMAPVLSVLIGARDAAVTLADCLESLEPQVDDRVEVIVADGSGGGTGRLVSARFPWARVVECGALNAAELRREAFRAAQGELIALAEPHVTFAGDWVETALGSGARDVCAVGGAVEPGPRRVCDIGSWAAFLCEYADFLPPLTAGLTRLTTGNNVIYPRPVLESSDLRDGLAKAWVNDGLVRRGKSFWTDPELIVRHERPYEFADFLSKRFHYGRCYGATRARGWPAHRRLMRALSTPLLPAVFAWRTARAVLPKRRYLRPWLLSQPLLVLFNVAWAIGEGCGYVAGAGESCARVY
jgi:hypothetical protein